MSRKTVIEFIIYTQAVANVFLVTRLVRLLGSFNRTPPHKIKHQVHSGSAAQ